MLLNGFFPVSAGIKSIDRLFNDFIPNKSKLNFKLPYLPVDVRDDNDSIIIQADIPGVKKEDIDIVVENGNLLISCQRQDNSEINSESFFYQERQSGKMSRSIVLPSEVDDQNIQAQLLNGVLTVIVPKSETSKRKRISIS